VLPRAADQLLTLHDSHTCACMQPAASLHPHASCALHVLVAAAASDGAWQHSICCMHSAQSSAAGYRPSFTLLVSLQGICRVTVCSPTKRDACNMSPPASAIRATTTTMDWTTATRCCYATVARMLAAQSCCMAAACCTRSCTRSYCPCRPWGNKVCVPPGLRPQQRPTKAQGNAAYPSKRPLHSNAGRRKESRSTTACAGPA
jgi:hypothetical protein